MTRRYFLHDLPAHGGVVELPSSEAQHATRVMRVQVGDAITLFDGKGHEAEATIADIKRNQCYCDSSAAIAVDREPMIALHYGISLPKPDRARELIERLTELGVKSVTPLLSDRTQRPPSESLLVKLRRGVVEACKQSGRNVLLEIRQSCDSATFFHQAEGDCRLIAHPTPQATGFSCASKRVAVAIGPEGGWTDAEVALAEDQGFERIGLGTRVYRIETAATAIAAVLVM